MTDNIILSKTCMFLRGMRRAFQQICISSYPHIWGFLGIRDQACPLEKWCIPSEVKALSDRVRKKTFGRPKVLSLFYRRLFRSLALARIEHRFLEYTHTVSRGKNNIYLYIQRLSLWFALTISCTESLYDYSLDKVCITSLRFPALLTLKPVHPAKPEQ